MCSKLLEVICMYILNHFEDNDLFLICSTALDSCESQILILIHDILQNFDDTYQTEGVILDISKAFDAIRHHLFLHRLSHYSIRDGLNSWFHTFPTDRHQRDGASYSPINIDSGVRQGTVLGSILFLCCINDLPASNKSNIKLFADNCDTGKLILMPTRRICKKIQGHCLSGQNHEFLDLCSKSVICYDSTGQDIF